MTTVDLAQTGTQLATLIKYEALAMADEFDQIRTIYGEGCLSFVKTSLREQKDSDWHEVVDRSISSWVADNPRMNFDLSG